MTKIRLHALQWFDDDTEMQFELYAKEAVRDARLRELLLCKKVSDDVMNRLQDLSKVWDVYWEIEDNLSSFSADGFEYLIDVDGAEYVVVDQDAPSLVA